MYDVTHIDWVSTLLMGRKETIYDDSHNQHGSKKARDDRRKARGKRSATVDAAQAMLRLKFPRVRESSPAEPTCLKAAEDVEESNKMSRGTQTDVTSMMINAMQKEVQERTSEIQNLKEKIKDLEISEKSFEQNNEKVKFYTGLPTLSILMVLLNYVGPHMKTSTTQYNDKVSAAATGFDASSTGLILTRLGLQIWYIQVHCSSSVQFLY